MSRLWCAVSCPPAKASVNRVAHVFFHASAFFSSAISARTALRETWNDSRLASLSKGLVLESMAAMYPVVAVVPMQAIFPTSALPMQPSSVHWDKQADEGARLVTPPPPADTGASSRRRSGRGGQKTGPPPQRQCAQAFKKTAICRYYPRCHQGDECKFAHASEELRVRPNLTKTRMCAGYYDGRCTLPASECGFAHGEEDLRPREVPYFSDPLPVGFGTSSRLGGAKWGSESEMAFGSRAPSTYAGSSSPTHSAASSSRSGLVTPEALPESELEEATPPASPRSSSTLSWAPEQSSEDEDLSCPHLWGQRALECAHTRNGVGLGRVSVWRHMQLMSRHDPS